MPPPDAVDTVPGTLEDLRPWLRDMRRELRENTDTTRANAEAIQRVEANTQQLVETFQAAKGFWDTVGWIGDAGLKVAKFAGVLALAGGAVWLWVKNVFESRGGS